MASTDAKPVAIKNQAFRVTFPLYDADGDLVTAAGSLDSEISKDGGTFTDCTNEATEIATSSGVYYLDLTADEMNADTVAIIVKSTGAKTLPMVFYPQESGDIPVDVQSISGDSTAADNAEAFFDGTGYAGTNNVIPTVTTATAVTTVNGLASGVITADSIATDAITAAKIAADAIGASELAADAVAEIADQVWEEAIADHSGTGGSTAAALNGAVAPTAAAVADAVWTEAIADHSGTAGSTAEQLASVAGTTGSNSVTVNVKDADTAANLNGVRISVYDDANTSLQTTGTTDSNGNAVFNLNSATYTLRFVFAGYSFTANQDLVVSGDQTSNYTGTEIATANPSDPSGCVVYGYLQDIGITAHQSLTITATAVTPQAVGTNIETTRAVTTTSDSNGYWEIELAQGAAVILTIGSTNVNKRFTVPAQASYDFTNEL